MLHALTYQDRVLFSVKEQACRHCGKGKLAPGFATRLLEFRVRLDEAMILSSCCRCKEHNDRPAAEGGAGGHPRSLHVFDYPARPTGGTCAVDVYTAHKPPEYRKAIIKLARELGWSIGFGSTFIHLDRRTDYTALPRAEFNY